MMRGLVISVTEVLLSDSNMIEYCVITNPFMHMNKIKLCGSFH